MEKTLTLDELREIFRTNIRARRRELSKTQADIAAEMGVSSSLITQYEAGDKVPSLEMLAKLAEALETAPDALLRQHIFSSSSA